MFSHLCASVAHESAPATPATCAAVPGEAAAQSPNAPSTWTQAPWSLAQASSGPNGSLAPLFTLPACRQTIAGPVQRGQAAGTMRPWPSAGRHDGPVAAEPDQAERLAHGGVRLGADDHE